MLKNDIIHRYIKSKNLNKSCLWRGFILFKVLKMKTKHFFPMVIRFLDTGKVKTVFSLQELSKHQKQPITIIHNSHIYSKV